MPTKTSMIMAQMPSRMLLTALSPKISLTLLLLMNEKPRSQWIVRLQKSTYCTHSGSSRP